MTRTRKRTMLVLRLVLVMAAVKITDFAVESASFRPQQDPKQSAVASPRDHRFPSDQQRDLQSYRDYPPYCGVPTEMEYRSIPPLRDYLPNKNGNGTKPKHLIVGETRLVHVTAVIRHGARTPWSNEMKCWDGYWESPETGKWDCDNLTTFMGTPINNGEKRTNNNNVLLFEKKYDALLFPDEGLVNVLNGTCQMGQLLQQGYDQQMTNGKILREAYTYRAGEYDHDERMRLLDVNVDDNADNSVSGLLDSPNLYFRADDYQRTIMSGQVLLRSLFDPELASHQKAHPFRDLSIPLHIADEDKDVLDANERDCPRLKTIKEEAIASEDYQAFYNSTNSVEVRDYLSTQLGMGDESSILDCFMCTLCTDRPLPESVDDYDGTNSSSWFTRLTNYEIQKYTTIMKHNDAKYAKLGMGPLWYEIMAHINNAIATDASSAATAAVPKLALFAGHDTTLMPLLASLDLWKDDTEWASYASMMLIEIHELIDGRSDPDVYTSSFAFRLLFNGKILTPMIDGCHEDCELCDIVHLKAIVDPIATRDTDCSTPEASSSSSSAATNNNGEVVQGEHPSFVSLSTTTGMVLFFTLIILSGFGGSAITFAVMRQRFTSGRNNNSVNSGGAWSIDDDDDYGLELSEGVDFR